MAANQSVQSQGLLRNHFGHSSGSQLDRKRCPQSVPHLSLSHISGYVSGTQTERTCRQICVSCDELCLKTKEKLICLNLFKLSILVLTFNYLFWANLNSTEYTCISRGSLIAPTADPFNPLLNLYITSPRLWSVFIYRITPQRAACRYKWGWPFSWKWPYGAIPACRYKARYAFPRNFCHFSYTSFIIQIWVILTQFHFKSIVPKSKFIWASLLIQKFYFNPLNPLNFRFLLQYLFERR